MVMDTALTHPDFFLLGLLSVVDALLDQPMGEVLAHLAVSEEVRVALCGGSNRLRDVYEVLLDYERGDWKAAAALEVRPSPLPQAQAITHLMSSAPWPAKIAALTSAVSPGIGTPALSSPTMTNTAK